jgi:hypothetical protein
MKAGAAASFQFKADWEVSIPVTFEPTRSFTSGIVKMFDLGNTRSASRIKIQSHNIINQQEQPAR